MALGARAIIKQTIFDRVPNLLRHGPRTHKRVAITFDDGPDEQTPALLALLDELDIPATFFLVGDFAKAHPAHVREYLRRGHQIAGHGYDHASFPKLSVAALRDQCQRTNELIAGQLPGRPWVRPPHGALDLRSIATLLAGGYTIALWSLDSKDYEDHDPASLADRCSPANVGPGEVLLFHEGQAWTRAALPRIVTALHAAGYECVTMHDLFES